MASLHNSQISFNENSDQIGPMPITNVNMSNISSDLLQDYPDININRELFHSYSIINERPLVIPVENECFIKMITRKFYEEGLSSALRSTGTLNAELYPVSSIIAKYLIRFMDIGEKIQSVCWPRLSLQKTVETRQLNRPIRCIQWHPNFFKLAVCASDDSIRVYTKTSNIVPVLKSVQQKSVTCISWRPFCSGDLAVGCENGVLIWSLDLNSHLKRPITQASLLKLENHMPINNIEYSPNGCYLASGSNSEIVIWDVDKNESTILMKIGTACAIISWSLDGLKLCCSTFGNILRVWSTESWASDKWTLENGTIQSVAWSSCGLYLLFITTKDPHLYSISFVEEQFFTTSSLQRAIPLVDLSKITIKQEAVGGIPLNISWCPRSHYLAVTFRDSSTIAIFTTVINRNMINISATCFLSGISSECPIVTSFIKNNLKQSILTIGWSSGRIQYYPIQI